MPLALLALAIGAFGIGTTEFVIMGVLPEVAAAHGAFFGIGSVVAADLVAPDKKASAISPMFMGLTVANTTDAGPTLSRDDAVGLKVRALHDRGFPRDVIDVFSARDLYTTGELERLGAQHDEEFGLEELHSRLEGVDFTSDREYAAYGMSPDLITELRTWVQHWLDDLGLRLAEPYDDSD